MAIFVSTCSWVRALSRTASVRMARCRFAGMGVSLITKEPGWVAAHGHRVAHAVG